MTVEEYEKEFPDNMVFYDGEYYSSVDECLEHLTGDYCVENFVEVKYIYGTEKNRVKLDSDNIIVDLEEKSNLEDWEVDEQGKKEFEEFVVKWNDKYGTDCYMENNTVVILISDKVKKKIYRIKSKHW